MGDGAGTVGEGNAPAPEETWTAGQRGGLARHGEGTQGPAKARRARWCEGRGGYTATPKGRPWASDEGAAQARDAEPHGCSVAEPAHQRGNDGQRHGNRRNRRRVGRWRGTVGVVGRWGGRRVEGEAAAVVVMVREVVVVVVVVVVVW